MINFESDYTEGAHPAVLEALCRTNMEQLSGYGSDHYCESAKAKIKALCGRDDAEVHFLVGGTQTNQIVISSVLQNYEGVVAADTGHISVHEAGAIEATGHKVLTVPQKEGKMNAADLRTFVSGFYNDGNHDHMVFPGMVYISHPTEYGTLYTKQELKDLKEVCNEFGMPLFLDGARLGYGLMADGTDVSLKDIAELTDVFYIGGTKVGALCGEAVVFTHANTPKHFITTVKQHGALLAKGRLLGIQFDALFTDDLYFKISRNAIEKAQLLKDALRRYGYQFYLETPTNQIFIILENKKKEEIEKEVRVSFWEALDENHTVVRFATSWATTSENLSRVIEILK
ncbi:MAG: aminotransferase class I/II-fold pyridoxal phosphate-dependent enzyme [Solobacterium sp.]|nr:aminotransferase class I/II-fold pyridoxal phosphate-dependent enzyme [Solobacterium sp.]